MSVVEQVRERSAGLADREPDEPLDDLRPLAAMVGDARVVALGAAARGTREPTVLAHRVVRLLVEERGFRSVALEGDDPVRLGLAAHVATGEGDPRRMLAGARPFLRTEEVLALVHWMRARNARHPGDPVRFAELPERPARGDGLAGLERDLADNVAWWEERSGDRIVYWGGMAHTAVGDPLTLTQDEFVGAHRTMGAHLRERLGDGYRSIGLTLGRGTAGVTLPAPDAGFADAVLGEAAAGRAGYVLDLREEHPEPLRAWLGSPARTRLVGPSYDPARDAAFHLSGGALRDWFDAVVHTEEVTSARFL
ncbi:erythromycin esterase family protein [Actinomadura kijaniata]|uniref:erythromycin esterase family protein n=1 Tax=Actinomadura kijaniata TaxID=46161 RepID=UPI00082E28BA|nr:erythromycin esterase family protein [Actinomadura kijaniata]